MPAFDPNNLRHKIAHARTQIILRDPFFATILMDMDPIIEDGDRTDTCATNGEEVIFHPTWLADADLKTVAAAMRKMSLHVALSHHLRRGPTRKVGLWQAACDQAALHIMAKEKLTLPEGAFANPMFAGMTAEEIYRVLKDMPPSDDGNDGGQDGQGAGQGGGQPQGQPQGGQGGGQGQTPPQGGQGGGQGQTPPQGGQGGGKPQGQPQTGPGVGSPLDGADMRKQGDVDEAQAKNDQRIIRAAMAEKSQGKESGFAKSLVDQIRSPSVDWRDALQAFINDRAVTRRSWRRPDRRFVGMDIYLPGKTADGIAELGIIIDTSGSMSDVELGAIVGQIEAAREAIGIRKVVIIQIDTRIKSVDEYDMTDPLPTTMKFLGRGGTELRPAFKRMMDDFQPTAIICATDGYISKIDVDPGVPVLFAVTHAGTADNLADFDHTVISLPDPDDL